MLRSGKPQWRNEPGRNVIARRGICSRDAKGDWCTYMTCPGYDRRDIAFSDCQKVLPHA